MASRSSKRLPGQLQLPDLTADTPFPPPSGNQIIHRSLQTPAFVLPHIVPASFVCSLPCCSIALQVRTSLHEERLTADDFKPFDWAGRFEGPGRYSSSSEAWSTSSDRGEAVGS